MKRAWLGLVLILAISCNTPMAWVAPPAQVNLAGGFTVRAEAGWNRLEGKGKPEHQDLWTVNGPALDQVRFFTGIASGLPLDPHQAKPGQKLPAFEARMEPEDIVELYGTFASGDGGSFHLDKLGPCAFAGGPGFRFEFTRVRKADEVTLRGTGYGRVANNNLYLMVFQAARIHYYAAVGPKVEALAASARID